MEVKKHSLAQKKINGAISTFTTASNEVEKAVELIDVSISEDKKKMDNYFNQIRSLEQAIDEVNSNVISKESEKQSYLDLAKKLKQFTVGGN
jgi:uncharacterized protein Yka (UPF0111/DUF47 family)